ncbi:hypothetical protein [Polaribacter sp. KT25b]
MREYSQIDSYIHWYNTKRIPSVIRLFNSSRDGNNVKKYQN